MAFVIYDTATGALVQIENQDPDPDLTDLTGLSVIERTVPATIWVWDPVTLDFAEDLSQIKDGQKALLTEVRDETILCTVDTVDYGTFYADDKSKLYLAGKLLGILLMEGLGQTPPATVAFKRVDGWHDFTLADFKLAALQVLGGIEAVFDQQKTLEDEVDAATTKDDVQDVTWGV